MKIVLAHNAGFCLGVRRAVETTIDLVHQEKSGISTFGPLIHNPQVLDLLEEQGVSILKDIPEETDGTVIIRAHGVPPEQKEALIKSGAKVQDATCPRVVKVQAIIKKYRKKGYETIIIGDKDHAEVVGLMGYAEPMVHVVSDERDIVSLEVTSPYIIVSQTTQDKTIFNQLCELIAAKFPNGEVFNTICDSTRKRQDEVRDLCKKVDAIVVVGGKKSANTQRLGQIAEERGCFVFMAETEDDLDFDKLKEYSRVGVTAGASTPIWMINRIIRVLESIPGKDEGLLNSFLFKAIWYLLATNIYVAFAGGLLAYGCTELLGANLGSHPFWLAGGYLFAMHNFNRIANRESGKFNNPLRLRFFQTFRWPIMITSIIALAIAHFIAYGFGHAAFYLLFGMSILGVLYSVRVVPRAISKLIKFRRLKEIPGSKTFFIALAWAFVAVLLPALAIEKPDLQTLAVFSVVLCIVFVRNALFDVFDVQGDRIVGKETLPVCIGERKTMHLLQGILLLVFVVLFGLPLLGLIPYWSYIAIPALFLLFFIVRLYLKGSVRHGTRLEFAVESVFILWSILLVGGRVFLTG